MTGSNNSLLTQGIIQREPTRHWPTTSITLITKCNLKNGIFYYYYPDHKITWLWSMQKACRMTRNLSLH